ncbi:MAG: MarR family transcriptional regulator [Rhodospirillales bacterium]|jgi:MarR family 2-MHQ and catechol resistance regulon transcriptional repressor|nr:MarR family transcriptional regulator [Rhodospirillales bacterium]
MVGVEDPCTIAAVGAYVKLLRAARAVVGAVEPRLAANALTTTQLGVLEALLHKGPMSQRELGRKVLTSAANMTDVLDKLQARGLIARCRASSDRRSVSVGLTDAGRALIEALFPRHAADIARAMSGLTRPELERLAALLRKLGHAAAEVPGGACALAAKEEKDHMPG